MPETNLRELVAASGRLVFGDPDARIDAITYDSRKVRGEGTLYAAFVGANHDGHDFIYQAVDRGASAILVSRDVPEIEDMLRSRGIALIQADDTRRALGDMAAVFYENPSSKLVVTGVTGTKGKTTTTHALAWILESTGHPSGLIGTISYRTGAGVVPAPNTTPEAAQLQSILYDMVESGQSYAVMEVSSHAAALGRIDQVDFDVGVFTNIGHDHMDFHKTIENYVGAKASFFRSLGSHGRREGKPWPKMAVINADDSNSVHMIEAARAGGATVVTYSLTPTASYWAGEIALGARGTSYVLHMPDGASLGVRSSLMGRFNVYNSLAAIAAARVLGIDAAAAAAAVQSFPGVPGRFESVSEGQDFAVVVDYAHTPDSLANVLATARGIAEGRVICVFGCGGDRDRTKRSVMGRIAAQMADFSVVTSDNPRGEEPREIVREITEGMGPSEGRWKAIPDRSEAIQEAICMAAKGDVVLIAGKGHETYQIFRDRTVHFDDRETARAVLRELV